MSDALTDIARDGRRGRNFGIFMLSLEKFLSSNKKSSKMWKEVMQAARETDSVGGGFWGGRTNISSGLSEKVTKLIAGDKKTWAWLLSIANGSQRDILKELSPFKGMLIVNVDYGNGFVSFGDLGKLIAELIESRGWSTYDGDKYTVIFPRLNLKKADAIWMGNGRSGIEGPERKKR